MDWKLFFERYGNTPTDRIIGDTVTPEKLYQAIKARLMDELQVDVPNTSHYGRLKEKDK